MAKDRGYAWVVAFGCFVMSFIMAGLARAAGVLYVAVIDLYGCSREAATAPFCIRFSARNLSGPVVGLLGQKYGIRAVTAFGGFLAGVGGILCIFAPSVTWITILWGGVHGIGYGLCNLIHVMIINDYFDKYRGTAIGLVLSGDCFGTFAFPTIMELLLQRYGLNGTFLVLGGIALNVVPAAMLLRKPDQFTSSEIKASVTDEKTVVVKTSKNNLSCNVVPPTLFLVRHESVPCCESKTSLTDDLISQRKIENSNLSCSVAHSTCKECRLVSLVSETGYSNYGFLTDDTFEYTNEKCRDFGNSCACYSNSLTTFGTAYVVEKTTTSPNEIHTCIDVDTLNNKERKELHSDNHSKTVANNCKSKFLTKKNISSKFVNADLLPQNSSITHRSAVNEFFTTNTRPMFIVTAVTLATYVFLFIAILTIIIDYAADVGIPPKLRTHLIFSFSITDLFGRLALGVVLDKKWIKISHFAGLMASLTGLTILVIPFCRDFYYILVCLTINGLFQGGNNIMYPILVDHYMAKNESTFAMGCLNFYGGLLLLPLASVIGFFRDVVGSYDGVFWTVGSMCALSGVMWIFEPFLWNEKSKSVS